MATWKSTPEERAQAVQLVYRRMTSRGESMAESVAYLATALDVSEATLRRWVKEQASDESSDDGERELVSVAATYSPAPMKTPQPRPQTFGPAPDLLGEYRAEQVRRRLERDDARREAAEALLMERAAQRRGPMPYWAKATAAFSSGVGMVAVAVFSMSIFSGGGAPLNAAAANTDAPTTTAAGEAVAGEAPAFARTEESVAPQYDAGGVKFRAVFPGGEPTRAAAPWAGLGKQFEIVVLQSIDDAGLYQVSGLTVPAGVPIERGIDATRALTPPGFELVSTKDTSLDGHKAGELKVKGVIEGQLIQSKIVYAILDRSMVVVQVMVPDGDPDRAYDSFMRTFSLV